MNQRRRFYKGFIFKFISKILNIVLQNKRSVQLMAKKTGPTNIYLRKLIVALRKVGKKEKAPIWKKVADKLAKSRRQKVEVNLSDINRHAAKGETVVVPGVVLAEGKLDKTVNVAAWRFSYAAVEKITKAKGKAMTIRELLEKNPKGSKVKIMV